jgi:uncharacterized protein
MAQKFSPTKTGDRIKSLDILRGFAILGILIMNIQSFSMPGAAYMNPTAYGDLEGINKWVWIISHLFADQKFITIFSILFGAGIVLVTQNAETKRGRSAGLHYKRTFWLLVIGIIHAHLIWYGDILVPYAICALFVYLFRKKSPVTLLITGLVLMSIHTLIYGLFGISIESWPKEAFDSAKSGWIPNQTEINSEIAAITGSLPEQIRHNSQAALFMQTFVFPVMYLWRAGGLMLMGMALYKWKILQASRSRKFYVRGWLISWLIGFPIIIYGLVKNFDVNWSFEFSMFLGSQYNYWGSLFVSFGYICIIMLISQSTAGMAIKKRLAAIGQMALTNYIAQSVICVFIFYGVGFGLFGQVDRSTQLLITLAIWIIQYAWSKAWLDRYQFGPLEWLWRSLTYWKIQPMKRDDK